MPLPLDPSLPRSLYPLAWLIGSWDGHGALPLHDPDGQRSERLLEQSLQCVAQDDGTMAWTCLSHAVDAPAPLPPTSAFARPETAPSPHPGTGERTLLLRERGVWTVGDPLPGQDLEAARAAKPGEAAGVISFGVQARFEADGVRTVWDGEARGPRIRLVLRDETGRVEATRLFGTVAGRLMWLWERRALDAPDVESSGEATDENDLVPYMSVELDRA